MSQDYRTSYKQWTSSVQHDAWAEAENTGYNGLLQPGREAAFHRAGQANSERIY